MRNTKKVEITSDDSGFLPKGTYAFYILNRLSFTMPIAKKGTRFVYQDKVFDSFAEIEKHVWERQKDIHECKKCNSVIHYSDLNSGICDSCQ